MLDLLDDLSVVDDAVFEPCLGREMAEDVVPTARGYLGLRPRREQREVDVVDLDIRVVRLPPLLRVGAVEPRVVRWNEVAPLDDAERVLELLVPELRYSGGGGRLRERATVEDHEPAERLAHDLAAGEATGKP